MNEQHEHGKGHNTAHIKLGTEERTVPAGLTVVGDLKTELGVESDAVLYLVSGHQRRVLADQETIDVHSGMHFEAIRGGGVS